MDMAGKPKLSMDEFLALPDDPAGSRMELSEGELEMFPPPRRRHTLTMARLFRALDALVADRGLGEVAPSEAGYVLDGQTFRCPDVSFIRAERLASANLDGWVEGAPDLAVEVISPSETVKEMSEKRQQFLKAGSHEVWLIFPENRTAEIYTHDGRYRALKADDVLECPALLPGFVLRLGDLFD